MHSSSHAPPNVADITSYELRRYMRSHSEAEYVLIDVRQPEEYSGGHIPGAKLVPLKDLEEHARELQELSGRSLVFYCRSGTRSQRASTWASRSLRLPSVYNLLGGFQAWDGPALGEFPRRVEIDLTASVETLLRQALDFEKGIHRLYTQIVAEYPGGMLGATISQLTEIEITHGRAVYQLLRRYVPDINEDFISMFAALPGEVIENGLSYDVVLKTARELGKLGDVALLELALEIEMGAYDLYKSLAGTVTSIEARQALGELAQQEKEHADLIFAAIAMVAKAAQGHGGVLS
ncbi:MAG TPA: rhodanese-like domain-containing protein [Polyangiaceae bacterium]|nr:rhodanese-like domain-containing protein [Polyangiaceae bacterium]